jgi:hypothetical protein
MCTTQVCTVASGHVVRIASGGPFQAVAAHDQRVGDPAVAELGGHRHPLLRALTTRRTEPEAEDVAFAVEVHTNRDIETSSPQTFAAIAGTQGRSSGRCCQASMSSTIASVIFEIVSREIP